MAVEVEDNQYDDAEAQAQEVDMFQDEEPEYKEVSAKDLIDTLRGKFDDADKEFNKEFDQAKEKMKKAFNDEKSDLPKWMKKGLFAPSNQDDKKTKYTFEKEDGADEATPAPEKKHHHHHRKHHKPCMVITILAAALLAAHLYQLRHLAKSLNALQEMGVKVQSRKDKKKEKKDKKVADKADESEPKIEQVPAEINYSFDDHTIDCEDQPQMFIPVVQQPAPTTIVGNSHNMCWKWK